MVEASASTGLTPDGVFPSKSGGNQQPLNNRVHGVLTNGSSRTGNNDTIIGNVRSMNNCAATLSCRNTMGVENIRSVMSNPNTVSYTRKSPNAYTNGSYTNGFSSSNCVNYAGYGNNSISNPNVGYGAFHTTDDLPDMREHIWAARNGVISSSSAIREGINFSSNCVNVDLNGVGTSVGTRTMSNGELNRNAGCPNLFTRSHVQLCSNDELTTGDRTLSNNNSFTSDRQARPSEGRNGSLIDFVNRNASASNSRAIICGNGGGIPSVRQLQDASINHISYNRDSHEDQNALNPIIRGSSNNSSTASSRNSHPSTSSNSITNKPMPLDNSYSSNTQIHNGAGHRIHGILRHSGNGTSNNTGQTNANSSGDPINNPSASKIVRIDPNGDPSRDELTSTNLTRQLTERGSTNSEHTNVNRRLTSSQRPITTNGNSKNSQLQASSSQVRKEVQLTGPSEEIITVETQHSKPDKLLTPAEELRKAATIGDLGKIQTLLGKPPGNAAGAELVNQLDEVRKLLMSLLFFV